MKRIWFFLILKSIFKKKNSKKKKHLTSLGIDEIYPQLQHVPLLFRSFCLLPPNPQTGADSALIAPDAFERLKGNNKCVFFSNGFSWWESLGSCFWMSTKQSWEEYGPTSGTKQSTCPDESSKRRNNFTWSLSYARMLEKIPSGTLTYIAMAYPH